MEKEFWDEKWEKREMRWDIGKVSPPLKAYFDQISDKSMRILIPGCGNAYEAEYLMKLGFEQVYVVDISALALDSFRKRCPDFPKEYLIQGDFFELEGKDKFDLIIEQTFFCALHPDQRDAYCKQMHKIMHPKGKLVGLLFDFPLEDGPPFGGSKEEYEKRFSTYFNEVYIAPCYHSIPPRQGREFWISICDPVKSKVLLKPTDT
ncbi:MAG: methyltransferase domain-containing protein [Crocinitomicaceae bacterium]